MAWGFFRKLVVWLLVTISGKAILLFLGERGIYPEMRGADMLSFATREAWALWLAASLFGLLGLFMAEAYFWPWWRARSVGRYGSQPERDVWFQDAIFYAVYRRWVGTQEEVLQEDGDIAKAWAAIPRMRELAGEGKLTVWGKTAPNNLHEKIPPEYWVDHQPETFVVTGPPQDTKTEKAAVWGATDLVYMSLMCSKAEVEAIL